MPIDFSSLAKPQTVIVPIIHNNFQYNKKKFSTKEVDDGWWVVSIQGNKATPIEPHVWLGEEKNQVLGYTYGNQIVFQNFDVAKRLWGMNLTAPLHFNLADSFSAIKAIFWETGQFFYTSINYSDVSIYEVKSAFDNDQLLNNVKGITPELRTLFLFHAFERDQLREILRKKEEVEEHEKRMQDTAYRLKVTLERSGGKLIGYSRSGNRLIVDWELENGGYSYNSVLDADSWMVRECGFCCSGDDRRHNLTSMVKTAEDYENRDVIFITRH